MPRTERPSPEQLREAESQVDAFLRHASNYIPETLSDSRVLEEIMGTPAGLEAIVQRILKRGTGEIRDSLIQAYLKAQKQGVIDEYIRQAIGQTNRSQIGNREEDLQSIAEFEKKLR